MMFEFRTAHHTFAAAALIVAGMAQPCSAQTYPSQNIAFMVAFAAGGIADTIARLIGGKLAERLGQDGPRDWFLKLKTS